MSQHVALLGDSTFDNGSYTRGEPEVVAHLRRLLPAPWRASLLAVDGATTASLGAQCARVGDDVSHLVVSIGGNDALRNIGMLDTTVRSTAEALDLFEQRVSQFERDYRRALARVRALSRTTTLCTIYNGQLVDPREAARARLALMLFNDAIVRTAYTEGLDLVELRLVCSEPSDYANPIEPSGQGGEKIAHAVARAIGARSGARPCRSYF